MLTNFAAGNYRFFSGRAAAWSAGIVADDGFDLVHAVFRRPLPVTHGLQTARRVVEERGRPVAALTGFELRLPEPLSPEGFFAFSDRWVAELKAIGVVTGPPAPATRTNVAPTVDGVTEPSLSAFTYTVPGGRPTPAYRMSGVPEAPGLTDPAQAMSSILDTLDSRMAKLGVRWDDATNVSVYAGAPVPPEIMADIKRRVGVAALQGLTWIPSLPPMIGFQFEIDARSVGIERYI